MHLYVQRHEVVPINLRFSGKTITKKTMVIQRHKYMLLILSA
jgi:hypothetical protein